MLAAEEFDALGVIHWGVLFEGLVEEMEGAAQGGCAPGRVFFGFGHSWFFSCRFMNVFGIRRGFYQKNEEILSTPLPLNAPAVRPPLNSFIHHGGTEGTERRISDLRFQRSYGTNKELRKISRKAAKWITTKGHKSFTEENKENEGGWAGRRLRAARVRRTGYKVIADPIWSFWKRSWVCWLEFEAEQVQVCIVTRYLFIV